jgi:hypothetical protein
LASCVRQMGKDGVGGGSLRRQFSVFLFFAQGRGVFSRCFFAISAIAVEMPRASPDGFRLGVHLTALRLQQSVLHCALHVRRGWRDRSCCVDDLNATVLVSRRLDFEHDRSLLHVRARHEGAGRALDDHGLAWSMEEAASLILLHGQAVLLQQVVLIGRFGEPDTCVVDHDVAVQACNDAVSVLGLAVRVRAALGLLLTGPVVNSLSEEDRAARDFGNDPLQLLCGGTVGQLTNEDAGHALLGSGGVEDADILHGRWVRNEVQAALQFLVESPGNDYVLGL